MKKVVDELIGCWGVQWLASLPLTTEDGKVNLACYKLWSWEPPTSGPLAPEAPALCLPFYRLFIPILGASLEEPLLYISFILGGADSNPHDTVQWITKEQLCRSILKMC